MKKSINQSITRINIQTFHPRCRRWLENRVPVLDFGLVHHRKCSVLKQYDGFQPLLHASPYISQQEVDGWQQAILDGDDGALCGLLLSLLPNLQHLSIQHHLGQEMVYLKRMIDRILHASCEPQTDASRSKEIPTIEDSTCPHALQKFTTFGLQTPC